MQRLLRRFVQEDVLQLHPTSRAEADRLVGLMEQYRDTPMDLADASLVAAAEGLDWSRVFTLDHHFRVYRLPGNRAFEVIP